MSINFIHFLEEWKSIPVADNPRKREARIAYNNIYEAISMKL